MDHMWNFSVLTCSATEIKSCLNDTSIRENVNILLRDHLQELTIYSNVQFTQNHLNELSINRNIYTLATKEFPKDLLTSVHHQHLTLNLNAIELSADLFQNLKELKRLIVTENNSRKSRSLRASLKSNIFHGLPNLIEIQLKENHFIELPKGLFERNKNLTKVKLTDNRAALKWIPSGFLANLPKLMEVDLRSNGIESLPDNLFSGSSNVCDVSLAGNALKTLPENFLVWPKLINLDLSKNNFTRVPRGLLKDANQLISLKLSNDQIPGRNPWICDCDFYLFVIKESYALKNDSEKIVCDDGELLSNKSDLCQDVDNGKMYIFGTLFLLFILLILSVCSARFFTENEPNTNIIYDAFISYADGDREFIADKLLPGLEDFKLCIQFRDWLGGEYIPHAIAESIDCSHRTIVVLSQPFIRTVWSQIEFRTAHRKAILDGQPRLIMIVYGKIENVDSLDPELRVYLKTNRYIEWGDRRFFKKLKHAMSHPNKSKKTS